MKVTIDIPDVYIPILRKWASVSRSLIQAATLLENYSQGFDKEDDTRVRINDCLLELDDLTTPLDVLHQTLRSAIWEQDRKDKS